MSARSNGSRKAAFLYGRHAGVRSIVMPGTRLIRRMSPSSVRTRPTIRRRPRFSLSPLLYLYEDWVRFGVCSAVFLREPTR
jgi:hypothetical protein